MTRPIDLLHPPNIHLPSDRKERLLHRAIGHKTCIYTNTDLVIHYLLGPLIITFIVVLLLTTKFQTFIHKNTKSEYIKLLIIALLVFISSFIIFRWYCNWQIKRAHCRD